MFTLKATVPVGWYGGGSRVLFGSLGTMASRRTIAMATEVEETLKRIQSHRGVKGVLIVNTEGQPIRSNLSQDLADNYAALITQLCSKAASVVRTMDPSDDLTFLRIRSKQHEILVAPDKEYSLIVIQNPNLT